MRRVSELCRCIFSFFRSVYRRQKSMKIVWMFPECFDGLFVLFKDNITQQIKNMREASTPKRKLTAKVFHVNSFVVLFSYIFILMRQNVIKFIWSNPGDTVSKGTFGHTILCKGLIFLYKDNTVWYIQTDKQTQA